MSSAASTNSAVRPPLKHVRYLTDDSSYSSFSTTASVRREAEEQAFRELALERQASRQRVLSVWENLEQRYSRALEDDDIIDLESLTLVQDTGTLRAIADAPFGSLAAQDDVVSDNDEEDDELANWDDERYSAEHAWNRLQTGGPARPRTEEDDEDLRAFLRAEKTRKRAEDHASQDDSHTERGEEEDETELVTTEIGEANDEEEESVSSFRPTPSEDHQTTSASDSSQDDAEGESGSEDELDALKPVKKTRVVQTPQTKKGQNDDEASSVATSSEDEIAVSDVERERRFREKLRAEEPLGRGRFSSVKPSSPTDLRKQKHSGNPQLSTPPRSKSFSTPSDTFYQHSPPRQRATRTFVRSDSVARAAPSANQSSKAPPMPSTNLGKRKRHESPLPTPSSDDLSPRDYQRRAAYPSANPHWEEFRPQDDQRRYSHGRTDSSSHTEPPISVDDYDQEFNREYDEDGYESWDEVDALSSRGTPAPVQYRANHQVHRTHQNSGSARRLAAPDASRQEIIAPSDLSQLVFHLKKVNDWVKTYHGDELAFEEVLPLPLPSLPQRSPSKRPGWSTAAHVQGEDDWAMQTPPNRNRILSNRGAAGGSSGRSNRTYSSMGPPPTPSRLFETGSCASTSTQSTPNKSSPLRASSSRASSSSARVYRAAPRASSIRPNPAQESPRRKAYKPEHEDVDVDERYAARNVMIPRQELPPPKRRIIAQPIRAKSSRPLDTSGGSTSATRMTSSSRRY